jgi:hypothetical protein
LNVDVTYVSLYRLSGFALVEREVVETHDGLLVALELIAHWEPFPILYTKLINAGKPPALPAALTHELG